MTNGLKCDIICIMNANKQPKIKFFRTPVTETIVILASAENIYSNFYKENNFCVLPYLIDGNNKVIHFPRLKNMDKRFWKNSLNFHKDIENNKDDYVIELSKRIPYNSINIKDFKDNFLRTSDFGWNTLITIWPEFFRIVKNINIYISEFGAIATQYSSFFNDPTNINIFARYDTNIKEVYKMIFFERLRVFRGYAKFEWCEIMAVCESFVNDTILSQVSPTEYRTLTSVRSKKSGKLMAESRKYLQELGFYVGGTLNNRQNKVIHNGKYIYFPSQINKILVLLITNSGKIVTHEQMAKQLWGDSWLERFSLQAITQLVKRTRKMLKQYQIDPNIIQSVRGQGYLLKG